MAWVPIAESGLQFELFTSHPDIVSLVGSVVTSTASAPDDFSGFDIQFDALAPRLRISTAGPYQIYTEFGVSFPAQFNYGEHEQINESIDFDLEWLPTQFEFDVPETSNTLMYTPAVGSEWTVSDSYQFLIEVWIGTPPQPVTRRRTYVYELEKGWSFDGNYIPHFVEFNWYFGENPIDYHQVQKIRIHGLSKGNVALEVATNSMDENLYFTGYRTPQKINFPNHLMFVSQDYEPVTNYTDHQNRGVSVQMKFQGSNKNIALPEPSHVLQVLVLQTQPFGKRSN